MFGVLRAVALWVLLALLAAFVIFAEFVADVGGKAEPIPKPTSSPGASADPGAMTVDRIEAMLRPVWPYCSPCRASASSSSKTSSPLS